MFGASNWGLPCIRRPGWVPWGHVAGGDKTWHKCQSFFSRQVADGPVLCTSLESTHGPSKHVLLHIEYLIAQIMIMVPCTLLVCTLTTSQPSTPPIYSPSLLHSFMRLFNTVTHLRGVSPRPCPQVGRHLDDRPSTLRGAQSQRSTCMRLDSPGKRGAARGRGSAERPSVRSGADVRLDVLPGEPSAPHEDEGTLRHRTKARCAEVQIRSRLDVLPGARGAARKRGRASSPQQRPCSASTFTLESVRSRSQLRRSLRPRMRGFADTARGGRSRRLRRATARCTGSGRRAGTHALRSASASVMMAACVGERGARRAPPRGAAARGWGRNSATASSAPRRAPTRRSVAAEQQKVMHTRLDVLPDERGARRVPSRAAAPRRMRVRFVAA